MKRHGCFILFLLLSIVFTPITQAETTTYTTPQAFTDLYRDFTGGSTASDGSKTISQQLFDSEGEVSTINSQVGPLIMFVNSTLYIYNPDRTRVIAWLMRTAPNSGFTEMTAISHIGPALSYLAKIKANDGDYKPALENLLKDIKAVREANAAEQNNWLDKVDAPSWKPHLTNIRNMIDYACAMSGSYITDVLNGKDSFTLNSLQDNLFNGNKAYPIPFNNIMIGTFMLTALQSMDEIHDKISKIPNIDWANAKVIIRFVAGGNRTAGVSAGSNWLVPFVKSLSQNKLPNDRIFIAPYADVKASLGKAQLSEEDFAYYNNMWDATYSRVHIAKAVFTTIPSIFMPERPAIPGDYDYSRAADIDHFLIRLKYSFGTATEMLSNTVAFWMAGELANKNWDTTKIDIPGITTGFPEGISTYPDNNPEIAS